MQHRSTSEAHQRKPYLRVLLNTSRHQLQEWHVYQMIAVAQKREKYGRNNMPYQALQFVTHILTDKGQHTIHVVRTHTGRSTNNPDTVLQSVHDSVGAQHRDSLHDLHPRKSNNLSAASRKG